MTSEETKRLISEVIALYSLEETLKEVYVEGNNDKRFYQNYLYSKEIQGNFVSITTIDIASADEKYTRELDLNSNKNKLIVLSRIFDAQAKKFSIKCLVDRDFDDYIESDENEYLWRTDFCCLESYLFCGEIKRKFIDFALGDFPIELKTIISEIGRVTRFLFGIRLWREINEPSYQLLEIAGNLKIDKNTGEINLDEADYINKFIHKNGLNQNRDKIKEELKELQDRLDEDVRFAMNKYDFLNTFFLYVNKIKNTPNYREKSFCNSLYLTPESSHLEKHPLFQQIEEFFRDK